MLRKQEDDWEILTDGGEPIVGDPETDVAIGEGVTNQETAAPAATPEEKMVPLSVVEAVRGENKDLKENQALMQQQMNNLHQAQVNSQAPEQAGPPQEDEDIMTRGEVKQMMASGQAQTGNQMSEIAMRVQFKDYDAVVNTNLKNVIKSKPYLLDAIKSSSSPHALAYELGITDPDYKPVAVTPGDSDIAKRIAENQKKPGSVQQVSTGGQTTLDATFATMPSADFELEVEKVLAGG